MAPTIREIRRAIYYSDRFLDNLYQEVTFGGKTYGMFKLGPGLPLVIKLPTPIPHYGDVLMFDHSPVRSPTQIPDDCCWSNCDWSFYPGWTKNVSNFDGEKEESKVTAWVYDDALGDVAVAEFTVTEEPDPNDPTKKKVTVTVDNCDLDRLLDAALYFNGEFIDYFTKDIIGTSFSKTTGSFGCFPSNVYELRHDINLGYLYYWYDRPERRDRARKMISLLDDYGVWKDHHNLWDSFHPLWGATNGLPDEWQLNIYNLFLDCCVFLDLPRGVSETSPKFGFYPQFSKSCVSLEQTQDIYCYYPTPDLMGLYAIHLMNKYGSPTYKAPWWPACSGEASADDWLVKDITTCINGKFANADSVILWYSHKEGIAKYPPTISDEQVVFPPYFHAGYTAVAMAAFAELGYGFNYPLFPARGVPDWDAKDVADFLAECLIKMQWGYPNFDGRDYARFNKVANGVREGTLTYALVNHPDFLGGWCETLEWKDGEYYASDIPTAELTVIANRCLRIYEYYKYRT